MTIKGAGRSRFLPCPKRFSVIAMSEPSQSSRCRKISERNLVATECPCGQHQPICEGLKASFPILVFSDNLPALPVTHSWCQSADFLVGCLNSTIGLNSAPLSLRSPNIRTNLEETIHSTHAIVCAMSLC